jgi:hypothetical protein
MTVTVDRGLAVTVDADDDLGKFLLHVWADGSARRKLARENGGKWTRLAVEQAPHPDVAAAAEQPALNCEGAFFDAHTNDDIKFSPGRQLSPGRARLEQGNAPAYRRPMNSGADVNRPTLGEAPRRELVALCAMLLAACGPMTKASPTHERWTEPRVSSWDEVREYPPLMFTSQATLDCTISSTSPGAQTLTTVSGQGFTFSTPMLPLEESEVKLIGQGMMYRFNAFPSKAFDAKFTGLGEGSVTRMKAEIEVDVKQFQQPGGPGTAITFNAQDIDSDAAYVEFTGLWVRKKDQKKFPFRILFSRVTSGSGKVVPKTRDATTQVYSKMVSLGTPPAPATVTTTLFEAEDDVRELAQ